MTSSIFREIKLTEEEHGEVLEYVTSEEYLEKVRKYDKEREERFISIINKPNNKLFEILNKKFKKL